MLAGLNNVDFDAKSQKSKTLENRGSPKLEGKDQLLNLRRYYVQIKRKVPNFWLTLK